MKVMLHTVRFAAACLLLALGACGGGGDGGSGTGTPSPGTVVGPAGGTVTGPNGAKVVIPAGALATNTTMNIEQTSAGAPTLPAAFLSFGQMFAFTPHGTTFAVPVTITVPFDPALVPAGTAPGFYKTNAQNQWERIANVTVSGATVSAQVTGFSLGEAGIERALPLRTWTFAPTHEAAVSGDFDKPEVMHETRPFGLSSFLTVDDDPRKTMEAFSSADGVTFWVFSEDSGYVELRQSQGFFKRAPNATLQFVITAGVLEALDHNGTPTAEQCPSVGPCPLAQSFIEFKAQAVDLLGRLLLGANGEPVLDIQSYVSLAGHEAAWEEPFFGRDGEHKFPAWKRTDFEFTRDVNGDPGQHHPRLRLIRHLVHKLDLSRVDDEGGKFRVITNITAFTKSRGGESEIVAYLRDPATSGGMEMNFTGLDPTNEGFAEPVARAPEPCSRGPNPAAGVLQFSAPAYSQPEERFGGRNSRGILITRTQGSQGAVSVTASAGGGTALPGVHYTPRETTVFFAAGDTEPRILELEILPNGDAEADRTVNLTLSAPGGCATLGAQSSAVLTILDNDRQPPPPPPSGLDQSFGNGGKTTSTEILGKPNSAFGGDRSSMALQVDGKIVMVGGTFTDFILARFNADGSLDQGFGVGGKVTTDMGGGNRPEEATAVAIQPDGKIVVVGYTAIPTTPPAPALPPTFALARYNSNGSLDTSFGSGGKVSGNVNGNAFAVAIQGDGKIVVAGEVSFPTSGGQNFSDIVVARFNANGTLDTSFGADVTGQVVTDLGLATNSARNLVLQPNGAIVVSGKPQGNTAGFDHTDVVRYLANGLLDPTFGSGGKLTLAGALVGEGLALQSDGKFVLVGSVTVGTFPASSTRFALMRLNADGTADTSFGSAGTVSTAFTINAAAAGVALQRDGKIVAVGTTVLAVNPNFVVARYNADGSIDTGFGSNGNLSIDFFGFNDIGESVLVQPDGKIVVSGQAQNIFDGYGLARINP